MSDERYWTVTHRLPAARFVRKPEYAPQLVIQNSVIFRMTCPNGHAAPEFAALESAFSKEFVDMGCEQCGVNYRIPLGEWPSVFPEPERPTGR
jgi:hypothetical protein